MNALKWSLATAAAVSLLSFSPMVQAQAHVFTPESSLPQPNSPSGERMARTHLRLMVPSATQKYFGSTATQPDELPPFPGYFYETPASIACVYDLVKVKTKGCNPNDTTANPSGGSKAIAIVDAYDDPTAVSDLSVFSNQFGLPNAKFSVVYASANNKEPGQDPTGSWEIEESLDIEWSHAMAPEAQIFLVEAPNNSFSNLFYAVEVASSLVANAGGGEVSMSWGGGEFAGENLYDSIFTTPKVVYFASSGDSPGVEYPSASPNVVAAGGTTISRNPNTGDFILEDAWQVAGGGISQVEPRPAFQNSVKHIVGSYRGTPDFSFDANPTTGVWVYDSNAVIGTGWYVVGGTSVSSPSLSGIVNAANHFYPSSQAENTVLYNDPPSDVNDITYGNCGLYMANFTLQGYDLCTGVGSDRAYKGK